MEEDGLEYTGPTGGHGGYPGGRGAVAVRCERCGADGHVRVLTVDGFNGRLCESCYDQWMEMLNAAKA